MIHLSKPLKLSKQSKEVLNLLAEIKAAPLEVRIRVLKDVNNNVFLDKLKEDREISIAKFLLGDTRVHTKIKKEANQLVAQFEKKS